MTEIHKRPAAWSPASWERSSKDHRRNQDQSGPKHGYGGESDSNTKKEQESFARERTCLNQIQEAEQMREWVSKEDEFVLQQSKKKAHIRVREGRAKIIDWLVVTLSVIDPTRDPSDEDNDETNIDAVNPAAMLEGLSSTHLKDLEQEIDAYLALESNHSNRRYWKALKVICTSSQDRLLPEANKSQAPASVLADIDRLLNPKSLEELEALERQINSKLQSDEPIDVEYWEQLLCNVSVYKSKAELNAVYRTIIDSQLNDLRQEQRAEASSLKGKLALLIHESVDASCHQIKPISHSQEIDPEPSLKVRSEDKALEIIDEKEFLKMSSQERERVIKLKYVPLRQAHADRRVPAASIKPAEAPVPSVGRFAPAVSEDFSSATKALYEREVARGVQEDEEIFAGEEELCSASKPLWASKYRPRKPRYFNRVQMGYEWNKYNQTHYDHDNPPPKVVQGYKFNIFYPDLIDKVKAPTYRIERENGRKRGESFAPAGEEDTCLIRFISGPPYEDLAFRIVDKEWDYSAKRERGFRSSFDKGILQLHFQFKKVYYRK